MFMMIQYLLSEKSLMIAFTTKIFCLKFDLIVLIANHTLKQKFSHKNLDLLAEEEGREESSGATSGREKS